MSSLPHSCSTAFIVLWKGPDIYYNYLNNNNNNNNNIFIIIIIIIIIYSFRVFHINVSWWFFHWSLSDSKSPQVSRTRLRILVVFSNAVIWIVSNRQPYSKSSRLFNNPLVIVPKAPITIGTIVTFMFHSFFYSLTRSRYLSFFSHSISVILCSAGTAKSTILQILFLFFFFFLLIFLRSGLLAWIKWSVCMLKSLRSLCVSFSRTGVGLCIYHFLVWSNFNFLHISKWITLPTLSCHALYSFCANFLHSLIMWLIVSSLSPKSLHLLFSCILSIFALKWFVLMALSCASIRRYSISLLRFPFLSHVQIFCVRCCLLII